MKLIVRNCPTGAQKVAVKFWLLAYVPADPPESKNVAPHGLAGTGLPIFMFWENPNWLKAKNKKIITSDFFIKFLFERVMFYLISCGFIDLPSWVNSKAISV